MFKNHYRPLRVYKQSKLCNLLTAYEINRRYGSRNIRAYVVDPGLVSTDIGYKQTGWLVNLVWSLRKRSGKPAAITAQTYTYLCHEADKAAGLYYHGTKEQCYSSQVTDANAARLYDFSARQYDVNILTMACDLTSDESFNNLVTFIDRHRLRFDMLLNVAGIDHEGAFLSVESQNLQAIVDLDVTATIRITHAVLQRRRNHRNFYLLFVSSLASFYPMPLKATYASSKRFLLDFSLALGQELKSQQVRVLSLCPAGLATTDETLRSIIAQGIWGQLTTCRLEHLGRQTIQRLLSGRKCYVPGRINQTMNAAGYLLPRSLIAALIYSRWGKAQSRWM